jgi:ribosomal protein S27AE
MSGRPWSRQSVFFRFRALIVLWMIGGFTLGIIATLRKSPLAWTALGVLLVIVAMGSDRLRCPRCHSRVRPRKLGRPPRHCPHCGLSTTSAWA